MKPQKWNTYFRPVRIAWWASHLMHTPAGLKQHGVYNGNFLYSLLVSCVQVFQTANGNRWLIFWVSHSVLMTTGLSSFVLIKAVVFSSFFKDILNERLYQYEGGAVLVHNMPCYEALLCTTTAKKQILKHHAIQSISHLVIIFFIFLSQRHRDEKMIHFLQDPTPLQIYDLH